MGIYKDYLNSIYNDGAGGGGGGDVGAPYLKNIMPTTGVKVVDENGYIGGDFLGVRNPKTNYAIVVPGADFSGEGLGTVTFFVDTTATIGGRVYRTVTIGGVTWLAENLDYKFSGCGIGGTGEPIVPNAWYYDNNEAMYGIDGVRKCGLLYNGYAVKLLNDNRSELIPGWHVATKNDWDNLANAVGGAEVAATRLKALDYSINGIWPENWNGTDDFGFGILPAGYYRSDYLSEFNDIGIYGNVWTSTEISSTTLESIHFDTIDSSLSQNERPFTRGYSVRLVKDSA